MISLDCNNSSAISLTAIVGTGEHINYFTAALAHSTLDWLVAPDNSYNSIFSTESISSILTKFNILCKLRFLPDVA